MILGLRLRLRLGLEGSGVGWGGGVGEVRDKAISTQVVVEVEVCFKEFTGARENM